MPRLPAFDPGTKINHSPHVVILGAGASRAAFPKGDANGKRLPVMADLIDCLDLRPAIEAAGFSEDENFESIYDELATSDRNPSLKAEIEIRVRPYFEGLRLPDTPTLYDYLLLGLRKSDYVATFNWDPFLARAFARNRKTASLPRILFLHGNVEIGVCPADRVKGFKGDICRKCRKPIQMTKLLYPVQQKNYTSDPFITAEWKEFEAALKDGYMLTIFGYGAPVTDVEAVDLMLRGWGNNPAFELAEVEITDIKPKEELEKTWKRFFCRTHYSASTDIRDSWLFRYPRRSCEALAMATLQNDPWRENTLPNLKSLDQLHAWIAPLVLEEEKGSFTGSPCLQAEDFTEPVRQKAEKRGLDWVLDWLKLMSQGEVVPPFCVEVVMKDGSRYDLHSIVEFDEETRTACVRIWDLRAFNSDEISELKQRLNQIRDRKELAPAEAVHPKLDWANLHVPFDDIARVVEWHDRIWPNDVIPKKTVNNEK